VRSPSLKTLKRLGFPATQANAFKLACRYADAHEVLRRIVAESFPETAYWARSCLTDPFLTGLGRREIVLFMADEAMSTCGVEAHGHVWYCNAGDACAETLAFNADKDYAYVTDREAISRL
jgi:hypothetical protein